MPAIQVKTASKVIPQCYTFTTHGVPAHDDWSKSVHEIDLQLYRKYGLDEKEIEFIETHVKEMR